MMFVGNMRQNWQTDLFVSIGNHVSNPPALILEEVPQRGQQDAVAGLLLLGDLLGDRNENIDREQTHAILVVVGQILEQGYHFLNHDLGVQFLDELGQVVRCLSSHHGRFIVYEASEVLAEALLQRLRGLAVWGTVEASSGDLGGEPVGF